MRVVFPVSENKDEVLRYDGLCDCWRFLERDR